MKLMPGLLFQLCRVYSDGEWAQRVCSYFALLIHPNENPVADDIVFRYAVPRVRCGSTIDG